eukprot:100528_1
MGAEACGCKKPEIQDFESNMFKPTAIQQSWADAIKKNSIAGIKALHLQHYDIIDKPIDAHHICGIHVIVQNKQYEILEYFLQNQFDINTQETLYGNTPLHIASQNEDSNAIEQLFTYNDINDHIKNYQGKEACHMCSDRFKREYIKTKERGKALGRKLLKERKEQNIFGGHVNNFTTSSLKRFEDSNINFLTLNNGYHNENNLYLNGKYRKNGKYLTKFAMECGIDIDEMGMFLQRHMNNNIWNKLTRNKKAIKKSKDIEGILEGICVLTIKDKQKDQNGIKNSIHYDDKPPNKEAIRQLNEIICDKLRNTNGKINLNEIDFNKHFHNHLYTVHKQIMKGENQDY